MRWRRLAVEALATTVVVSVGWIAGCLIAAEVVSRYRERFFATNLSLPL